eukprot:CAMPEP_0179241578 /NCGR_PEP_ID=MMETSP0797-20121207/16568_1 /TAXON_ID=47934 /ORGANISM="Dinophysis acuminata, Strain DAEP01" /LENGTH=225 /DNA_ID=CAMNT_0020948975 /DNA_START=71 /DNA_END=748 /DNA_ORIENTATION=-
MCLAGSALALTGLGGNGTALAGGAAAPQEWFGRAMSLNATGKPHKHAPTDPFHKILRAVERRLVSGWPAAASRRAAGGSATTCNKAHNQLCGHCQTMKTENKDAIARAEQQRTKDGKFPPALSAAYALLNIDSNCGRKSGDGKTAEEILPTCRPDRYAEWHEQHGKNADICGTSTTGADADLRAYAKFAFCSACVQEKQEGTYRNMCKQGSKEYFECSLGLKKKK